MTSFIDKGGEVSIRLDKPDREAFIDQYQSRISMQYGKEMKEFVVVPDDLLARQDELRPWFVRSWEWAGRTAPSRSAHQDPTSDASPQDGRPARAAEPANVGVPWPTCSGRSAW